MATTRIKVPRSTLIERIQARIDSEKADYEEDLAKFKEELKTFLPELEAATKKLLDKIAVAKPEDGLFDEIGLGGHRYHGDPVYLRLYGLDPPRAVASLRVHHLEKMLRVLNASTDEFISVATSDEYANYL